MLCSALIKLRGLAVQRVEVTNETPAPSVTEIDVELHAVLDQVLIEGDPSADVDVEANIEVAGPML